MNLFGSNRQDLAIHKWQHQLDQFVKANQKELAALAWGLFLEKGESDETLGLDMKPKPHFVYCPRAAIEILNRQVNNQIQEILGVVDAHQPDQEVLIIGIGNGQLKLIQFEPELSPPECFDQVGKDVDQLLEELENKMSETIK
ncbi:beta-carboxysome assembly chaperone CcmS [Moorena producens]|uniref:beta-carboxysome assembly chaperone CcmS n=1 Tax=Moorena producens TaxID=1155739 RepID=UPI003C778395